MADIVLPSDRTTVFDANVNQGVVGGVRANGTAVNVASYGTLEEGVSGTASVNTSAFNAALAASAPGQDIVWPDGIYRCTALNIPYSYSNRKIRGGANYATELRPTGGFGFVAGVDPQFDNDGASKAVVLAGFTKGTTTFTTDTPYNAWTSTGINFIVGRVIRITIPDDPALPVVSPYGYGGGRSRLARVTSWNSGTKVLGFFPALDHDIAVTTGVSVSEAVYPTQQAVTIQDIHVNGIEGSMQSGVKTELTDQFAMHRVKVTNFIGKGVYFTNALCSEMRQCYVSSTLEGSNKSGIQIDYGTHCLVEHNISRDVFPNIQINLGAVGNIIAYNYFPGVTDSNHNYHNSLNLWEGNVTAYIVDDGYYGGSSEQIIFRNWSTTEVLAALKRFARNFTVIGNICGTPGATYTSFYYPRWGDPNIGNEVSNGTATPSASDWWYDWDTTLNRVKRWTATLTTRTSDSAGVFTLDVGQASEFATSRSLSLSNYRVVRWPGFAITQITVSAPVGDVVTCTGSSHTLPAEGTAVTFYPGPDGFQEQDLDVLLSADVRANYHVYGAAIPAGQALAGGETLPDSLYLTAKPSLFGDLAWPPFDPFAPGTPAIEDIPAGYYYTNGVWPTDTPAAPTITTDPLTQTATEGDDVTLSANATGSPTPAWQWKKNGSNISGATTRFLALLDVTEADEASYAAVATNSEGTDTSAAGVLTVNPAAPGGSTPNPLGNRGTRARLGAFIR